MFKVEQYSLRNKLTNPVFIHLQLGLYVFSRFLFGYFLLAAFIYDSGYLLGQTASSI